MSNYFEFNDEMAFHPGYYIKELVDASGLTQEDFAKRLGTTPKNLSILIRGEQSLSIDIAGKLSRMFGMSISFWLNIQQAYDEKRAQFLNEQELMREREVFRLIDYNYFRDNFDFPNLPRKTVEQIKLVREFLSVASLTVLQDRKLCANLLNCPSEPTLANIINANIMMQIAINSVVNTEAAKFNRRKFERTVARIFHQTEFHKEFLPELKQAFCDAGVVIVVLPNLRDSAVNGATKKVDGKVLLMINDRRRSTAAFLDAIFSEAKHIVDGDMGISFS